jgi:hypothetical protein
MRNFGGILVGVTTKGVAAGWKISAEVGLGWFSSWKVTDGWFTATLRAGGSFRLSAIEFVGSTC